MARIEQVPTPRGSTEAAPSPRIGTTILTLCEGTPRMHEPRIEFAEPEALDLLIAELEEKYSVPTHRFLREATIDADGIRSLFEREDPILGAFDFVRWLSYAELSARREPDIPVWDWYAEEDEATHPGRFLLVYLNAPFTASTYHRVPQAATG